MWQCVTVSATSEAGQQFFGSLFGQQWVQTVSLVTLTPGEIIWYQHHARGHQYENTSEHSPRLKALRKSPSNRSLSLLDNCPEKAGRAYVTTDKTIAVNTMCRALRERP